jgi:16S rRNA (cytidine1402-2'-O)-methyltransferase
VNSVAERQEDDAGGRRGYAIRGQSFAAPALESGLYIVATPIGNLADVTIRALDTLAGADLVACEDTRVTRKLLDRYGIATKVTSYHEHSGPAAHRRVLEALADGRSVALASDAGTPLISDPGFRLVADAAAAGHRVVPIPGPSSAVAALSAAGLATDAFLFLGFLPAKTGARRKRLAEAAATPATLVLFESPNRIGALLADAAEALGGTRPAAICRELTKLFETFDRGTLGELAARYAEADVKGEIVLVVAPPHAAAPPTEADVDEQLRAALGSMSVKEAAQTVAEATGLPRRTLYQRALALKAGDA